MAGSQLMHQLGQLRSGLTEPRSAVNDGALVSLAAVLVLLPGLVSTALGLLLMVPRVRSLAGPGLAAVAVRALRRRMPMVSYAVAYRTPSGPGAGRDYIDGEVVDVREFKQPALPEDAVRGGFPGRP